MSERQLRTWEALHTVTEQLQRVTGRELWTAAELSQTEFTVLAHLSEAPDAGVRPSLCARAIGWDSSRLSHQLRRLEKRGFVARGDGAGNDGRAAIITLTAEGRAAYRSALGPHLRSAQHWFAEALDDEQLEGLATALDALRAHLASDVAPPTHDE